MEQVCCVCSKEGAKRCSKCKFQYYCSKECQQGDWKNHKAVCRKGNSDDITVAKLHEVCSVCSKEGSKKCSNCNKEYHQSDRKNHKALCNEVNPKSFSLIPDICSMCSKEGAKRCSRCKVQFYCSKECQQSDWKNHKFQCNELDQKSLGRIRDICNVCLKGAKRCSRCKVQFYCSKECQQKDWKNHKTVCKLNQTSLNLTQNVCYICSKEASKRCSKCKVQFYCSRECQQKDWKNHKTVCQINETSLNLAQNICSMCSKEGAKRCSKCKVQFYCSKECQLSDWKNHKALCNELNQKSLGLVQDICSVCSKEGAKKCSKCEVKFYCSKECQKKDWKNHRAICKESGNVEEFKNSSEPLSDLPSEFLGTQRKLCHTFFPWRPQKG